MACAGWETEPTCNVVKGAWVMFYTKASKLQQRKELAVWGFLGPAGLSFGFKRVIFFGLASCNGI
jgi:hypothetical protein